MWMPLLILAMQLVIVPLTTIRTTFVVKGQRNIATVAGLAEETVYVVALAIVFSNLDNVWNMVAYAVGYAGGVNLGCRLEEKLAIGFRTVKVNLLDLDDKLLQTIRNNNFGVTIYKGEGLNHQTRYQLEIVVKRSREHELLDLLAVEAPKAFITAYEPVSFKGGYLIEKLKKKKPTETDLLNKEEIIQLPKQQDENTTNKKNKE